MQQTLCSIVSSETQFTCCQNHLYGPKMDQMSWTDLPGSCVDDVRDEALF